MNRRLPPARGEIQPYRESSPPPPYVEGEEPVLLDLRSVWGVISRNRWLILATFLLAVGLAYAYNERATPIYEASTSLRVGDQGAGGGNAAGLGFDLSQQGSTIETEMAVLRSDAIAEAIADSLGLQVRLVEPVGVDRKAVIAHAEIPEYPNEGTYLVEFGPDGASFKDSETGRSVSLPNVRLEPGPRADEFDRIEVRLVDIRRVVGGFQGRLSVSRPSQGENIIRISYQTPDPELSAEVVNTVARTFLAHRSAEHKRAASSTVEFLRSQIDKISTQLAAEEDELRDFREAGRVVNPGAQGMSKIGQLASLQGQRDAVESERAGLTRILNEIRNADPNAMGPSPARRLLGSPVILENRVATQMLTSLVALETERAELLSRRTPQDVDVQALTQRIEDIENELYSIASTYHQSLQDETRSLESSIGRTGGELREIPTTEIQLARLQRETGLLQQMYTLLQTKLKEAEITEAVEESNVRVVNVARPPLGPIYPNKLRNLLMAGALGLMLGVIGAFGREYADNTVHSMDEMEELSGVPVLGLIPRLPDDRIGNGKRKLLPSMGGGNGKPPASDRLVLSADSRHAVAEAFRSLRTNITFSSVGETPKSLLLTSPTAKDGKTTSTVNLAAGFAQQGLSVLVIDGDLRRGILHKVFGLRKVPGLSNLLVERLPLANVIQRVTMEGAPPIDVIAAGRYPPNPAEVLGSAAMRTLLGQLRDRYDIVVIDSPPLAVVTDAAVLAPAVDAVLLVARAGVTETPALEFAVRQLQNVGGNLKGTILNDVTSSSKRYGYGYYAYQYEYYGSEAEDEE